MLNFTELFAFCDLHTSRWYERQQSVFNLLASRDLIPMYYDRQGFPIPGDIDLHIPAVIMWARLFEQENYRRVAMDLLPGDSWLSTVWMGADHAFGVQRPLIFETMRFERRESYLTLKALEDTPYHKSLEFPDPRTGEMTEQIRYATEEEAKACHRQIVETLMEQMRRPLSQ